MTLTDLSPEALMDRMQTELPAAPIEVVRMYRDELLVREAAEGIGGLHRVASELVAGRRALVHSAQHDEKLTALAVSPCGHYLATGAWCGDDYEEGGDLVVWDLRTCAAVHVVSNIRGGVGWPWHPGQLRWAGDSQSLYLGFDTNRVGRLAVFATEAGWGLPGASLTGGWDSLPAWALAPDGTVAVLVPREDDEDQAIALFRVEDDDVEEADCTWLDNRMPEGMVREDEDLGGDDPTRAVSTIYSGARIDCPDERRVLVHNKDTLLCFDRGTRRLVWRSRVAKPVGISAGAEFVAHHPAGVVFYRGVDGLPSPWLPMHVGASALVFEPARGGERPPRMAAVIEADNEYGAEPGVHVYDGGEFVCGPDLSPASSSDEFDFPALAWSPDDKALAVLRANAERLGRTGTKAQKTAAAALLPAIDKKPSQLSGGMRKRASLARALALDPELLFLDEPTAGLDPIGAAHYDELVKGLCHSLGLTVLMVTHDLDSLNAICDRIAVLLDKRVVVGTMAEMLAYDHPWVREYFHGPRGRASRQE